MRHATKNSTIGLLASLVLALSIGPSDAVERHCHADIMVELNPRGTYGRITMDIERFRARGTATTANNARKEAKQRIINCAIDLWQERWNNGNLPDPPGVPNFCTGNVKDFEMTNIKCSVYDAVCRAKNVELRSNAIKETAIVWVNVYGKTKCSHAVLFSENYGVERCNSAERAKVCGSAPQSFVRSSKRD